ncbi:hypothetical protein [Citrobacter sp. R-1.5.2]|uniref:hypothetical protein n=1 Tax=Citrobacter sp. R-1.5.2 TaxID=3046183 RepID=UPI002B24BAF5|nr:MULTISPECIES: hypothetical protein [Citrobacter]MEB1083176.1 hypothetical protein [Citrobacter portucalensis]MEB2421249.1 hypothetical protein [Citrobacter sp. R-1.5.2]
MKENLLQYELHASTWLEVLSTVYPITGVMIIGAGTGNGPWVEWLYQRTISQVWVIEGEQKQYQHLQRNFPSREGWMLHNEIIVPDEQTTYFYQASNPWESGLIDPSLLTSIWPNLHSLNREPVNDGITLKTFVQKYTTSVNWLIIDCLPAAPLFERAQEQITQLDIVIVRVLLNDNPLSASLAQVDSVLSKAGMRRLQLLSERHPDLAYAIYIKDQLALQAGMAKEIAQLQHQLLQADNTIQSLRENYELQVEKIKSQVQQEEIQQLKNECTTQTQILLKIEALHETAQSTQKRGIEQVISALDELHHQGNTENELLKSLAIQFDSESIKRKEENDLLISQNSAGQEKHYQIIEKILALTTEQSLQQEKRHKEWPSVLKRELNNKLVNTARQIESFIAIQNYLSTGEGIASFHGWPISADIGLFLLEKMKERQYDAIIEFGSGTSTLLMAKALRALNLDKNITYKSIITFEHNEEYFLKTQNQLALHKVENLVNLCLVPLKEWSDATGNYRYYDCEDTLENLSKQLHGDKKKILVLVDGPPGDTCAHARYPAAPFLLNLSKEHEIDWILDDAYRPEEMGSANLWKDIWTENGIPFTDDFIKNEKGMYVSSTNK